MPTSRPALLRYGFSSASLLSASLAQLATFAILARALGPAEFGQFVQITALTAIAIQLCGLGASDCLMRRVSRDPASYRRMIGHNLILIGATGALIVGIGVPAIFYLTHAWMGINISLLSTTLMLVSNIILTRLVLIVETVFLSLGRTGAANCFVVGFAAIRLATVGIAVYGFGVTSLDAWAVWQFGVILLYALFGALCLRPLGAPDWQVQRDEVRSGALFSSQFVVRAVRQNVDLAMIGLFTPIEVVGSFGVARRILDSSFLMMDALNRLVYPTFARESLHGIHHALPVARQVLAAALAIGCATGLLLFLAAPSLVLLFGHDYDRLTGFVRGLSGVIVFVAIWSVAIDLLGASGRQDLRALILNGLNLAGSAMIAGATVLDAPTGTILALYGVEFSIAVVSWLVLLRLTGRSARLERESLA